MHLFSPCHAFTRECSLDLRTCLDCTAAFCSLTVHKHIFSLCLTVFCCDSLFPGESGKNFQTSGPFLPDFGIQSEHLQRQRDGQ